MAVSAADVKKLREETDAPMMECKAALDEANGDYEKAKIILREKGKAAAAKRQDRTTAAGVVAFASSPDGKTLGGVVLESETDFVAKNEEFVSIAKQIATLVRDHEPVQDPNSIPGVKELVEQAVAKIRENIRVAKAVKLVSSNPIATYVHHDNTKGSAVAFEIGDGTNEELRKVAVHTTAFPPEVISKEQLSQEKLEAEIEIETQRAMNEGKAEDLAKNIARGRVNKEYVKKAVLLEQGFYLDDSKPVGQYLTEHGNAKIADFAYLAVGQGS